MKEYYDSEASDVLVSRSIYGCMPVNVTDINYQAVGLVQIVWHDTAEIRVE